MGCSNCWGDSLWLYNKLGANGIQCRIMGFTNKADDRHTWVEINLGNGWVEFPGYLTSQRKWKGHHYGNTGK